MKRKAEEDPGPGSVTKKAAVEANGSAQLREGLLQQADEYNKQYAASQP